MAKLSKALPYEHRNRKLVPSGQKVPMKLSNRERGLILEHTFADDELTAPLRVVSTSNKASVYSFTLDDLEELAGLIRWHSRNVAVPLSQLVAIDADESTLEAIGDWHYWLGARLLFLSQAAPLRVTHAGQHRRRL